MTGLTGRGWELPCRAVNFNIFQMAIAYMSYEVYVFLNSEALQTHRKNGIIRGHT